MRAYSPPCVSFSVNCENGTTHRLEMSQQGKTHTTWRYKKNPNIYARIGFVEIFTCKNAGSLSEHEAEDVV